MCARARGSSASDNVFDKATGDITIPSPTRFGTILTDFGTKNFLAFLDFESQRGNARLLAEPNLVAGNRDSATFLAAVSSQCRSRSPVRAASSR
jgi:Flp pilus assembly secretin CpaC